MSADNYLLVQKHEGSYYVTNESMSADRPMTIPEWESMRGEWSRNPAPLDKFDTLADAEAWVDQWHLDGGWTEYGVSYSTEVRAEADLRASRLLDLDRVIEIIELFRPSPDMRTMHEDDRAGRWVNDVIEELIETLEAEVA